MSNSTLCTTAEVAERLRVNSGTIRRWAATGFLKPALITPGGHYRFDPADVDALRAKTVGAA